MANLNAFYFPGQIVEKKELHELEEKGTSVINFVAKFTQEVVAGFKEDFEKRIVMFARKAEEAEETIEKGDFVIFSCCKRNPRQFTTDAGNDIKSVDILAEQFKVVKAADFPRIAKALKADIPDMNLLAFTDADARMLKAKGAISEADKPDI